MKRFLSVFIAFTLALSLAGSVCATNVNVLREGAAEPQSVSDPSTWVEYEVTGGNIYFDPETQNIVGCDETVTEAVIPAEIDGKAVRMIVSMKPISGTSQLEKVTISDGILVISANAFYNCSNLLEAELPDSILEIGNSAFAYCLSLVSIVLPARITSISENLFMYCTSLQTVVIQQGVKEIGKYAFRGCSSLENITLSEGLINIGESAFADCVSLKSIILPETLEGIDHYAFKNAGIETITLPASVSRLKTPSQYIYGGVFDDCKNLYEINVDPNNPTFYSEDGVLFERNNVWDYLLCYPMEKKNEKYVLLNDETIGQFKNSYLKELEFKAKPYVIETPDGGTSHRYGFGISGFFNCVNLTTVILPLDTTAIASGSFKESYNITDVYFGGCEERWNKRVLPNIGTNNGSLLAANLHYNENDHVIQGIELEVDEHISVAKFESEIRGYYYNTYYQSKPFSLMENSVLVAMLDGNDLKIKMMITGWDSISYDIYSGGGWVHNGTITTDGAECTIENVIPESGNLSVNVYLNKMDTQEHLGWISVDSYGNLSSKLYTGDSEYSVQGLGIPVDFPIHFGSADLDEAYGGELSDYEVEVFYIENGKKVTVGREKMSAGSAHEHVFGEDWMKDDENHWHVCQKCSQISEPEPHTIENGVCIVCGYVQPEHVHNFTCVGVESVHWDQCEACGFTQNVREHNFDGDVCTDCGYRFVPKYDVTGDGEITLEDAIAILKKAMNVGN